MIQSWRRSSSMVDAIDLVFLGIMTLILIGTETPYRMEVIAAFLMLLGLLLLMSRLRSRSSHSNWHRLIQFIYPIIFFFAIFETFFMILPYFNVNRYDQLLINIDLALFGFHPTVWIEQFFHPALTELLYICYFLYFPMPLVPVIYLYRKKEWKHLEQTLFVFMMCYYIGYLGYFLIPASGPRFNLSEFQTLPLEGYWLTQPIRALIEILEPNKLDAFPSLHSAILTTTMLTTYRIHRTLFKWYIPLALGIFVSLIYCRYHYFIDIVGGVLYALISYPIALMLFKKYQDRLAPHFSSPEQGAVR